MGIFSARWPRGDSHYEGLICKGKNIIPDIMEYQCLYYSRISPLPPLLGWRRWIMSTQSMGRRYISRKYLRFYFCSNFQVFKMTQDEVAKEVKNSGKEIVLEIERFISEKLIILRLNYFQGRLHCPKFC